MKTFTSTNALASADVALERKFKDTVLAHKSVITDYSPLTDIHSDAMGLFVDEDTATFLSDIGINVDGLGEDFLGIESVSATAYMEEVAVDVGKLKSERCSLNGDLARVKEQIKREIGIVNDSMSFEELLASHRVSDGLVQRYLSLCEKVRQIQVQLGQASDVVFSETKNPDSFAGKSRVRPIGAMRLMLHLLHSDKTASGGAVCPNDLRISCAVNKE